MTTTGILADLVRNVAGDRATVTQMVPDGADPHSYEPGLRTVRDVAYADLAFSNYLLLEEHAIIRTLDANLPRGAVSVSIAEEASKEGATILPLVEDRALEAVWLGMRVAGTGSRYGADRASQVDLSVTGVEGPGDASAYLTTTFGAPEVGFTSSDGFDAGDGYRQDTSTLPADAHQHMSWAFTAPGVYRVHLSASLRTRAGARPVPVGEVTAVFAVGVDPAQVAAAEGRQVLEAEHADVTVDLEAGAVDLMVDARVLADAGGAGPRAGRTCPGARGSGPPYPLPVPPRPVPLRSPVPTRPGLPRLPAPTRLPAPPGPPRPAPPGPPRCPAWRPGAWTMSSSPCPAAPWPRCPPPAATASWAPLAARSTCCPRRSWASTSTGRSTPTCGTTPTTPPPTCASSVTASSRSTPAVRPPTGPTPRPIWPGSTRSTPR